MQLNECLNLLNLDSRATSEDVKRSFRKLAHLYHPDHGGSANKFRQLNSAYQFLLDNPQLIKKSNLVVIPKGTPILYRILEPRETHGNFYDRVAVPFDKVEEDTVLWCMWGSQEFRLFLKKNMTIPTKLSVDLNRSFIIDVGRLVYKNCKLTISVSEGY